MKNSAIWLWPVKGLFFFLVNSFNAFIAMVGASYWYPDFTSGYLSGKEALYDSQWFPIGLLVHASSAPIGLLLISLLVVFRIEQYPKAHRFLGKLTLILLIGFIVPSGWILSYYAMGGVIGKLTFFLLSSYTAFAAIQGYTAIRKREKKVHKQWMNEVFLLLLSAIFLRLLLVTFFKLDFTGDSAYNTAAILSWVPSILILKWCYRATKTIKN